MYDRLGRAQPCMNWIKLEEENKVKLTVTKVGLESASSPPTCETPHPFSYFQNKTFYLNLCILLPFNF